MANQGDVQVFICKVCKTGEPHIYCVNIHERMPASTQQTRITAYWECSRCGNKIGQSEKYV